MCHINTIAMRKITTLLFLMIVFIPVLTQGQQSISDLTANAEEANGQLISIYDLDVFAYFNITDYDTELKQAVYKKSEDYKIKLAELKGIKNESLKKSFYTKLQEPFTNVDYNLKQGGFEIVLGENWGYGTFSARVPKSVNEFLFKSLPTKQVTSPMMGKGFFQEVLLIKMSEENGLEIENDKQNFDIYFFFTPSGKEKVSFKFFNAVDNAYAGWYDMSGTIIKSDKVRVVVANKVSGKIYFDKTYSYQPPVKK